MDEVDAYCISLKYFIYMYKKHQETPILSAYHIIIRLKKHSFAQYGHSIFYVNIPLPRITAETYVTIHDKRLWAGVDLNEYNHQIFIGHLPGDRHRSIRRTHMQIKESLDEWIYSWHSICFRMKTLSRIIDSILYCFTFDRPERKEEEKKFGRKKSVAIFNLSNLACHLGLGKI